MAVPLESFTIVRAPDAGKPWREVDIGPPHTYSCFHEAPPAPAVGGLPRLTMRRGLVLLCLLASVSVWAQQDMMKEAADLLTLFLRIDRKSTRLNSSHSQISYAVFCF